MNTKRLTPIVGLLCLLGLFACSHRKLPTGGGSTARPFPNEVGMLWVYEVYDSLTANTDTVWVSCTDSVNVAEEFDAIRWRFHRTSSDSVVMEYVVRREDTVEISLETTGPQDIERLVFPLTLGSEWTGPGDNDTSRVTEVGTVQVSDWAFAAAALVERSWNRDIEGGGNRSETWVAPNFGIVSRHLLSQYSDGSITTVTVNQTWRLIRYDLTTFSLTVFPNKVGDWFEYQVIDSLSGGVDTVTATIAAEVELTWGDSGRMWLFVGREQTDTVYLGIVDSDNLFVSSDPRVLLFDTWHYEFPLAVGRYWGMDYFAPVPAVTDKGPVTALAGRFPSAFHYEMSGGVFNDYWTVDQWLVPGVGMVAGRYWRRGFGPQYDSYFSLIRYKMQRTLPLP